MKPERGQERSFLPRDNIVVGIDLRESWRSTNFVSKLTRRIRNRPFPQVLCAYDGLPFVLAFRQRYTTEPGLGGARPAQ
jgi:hypothetical protein